MQVCIFITLEYAYPSLFLKNATFCVGKTFVMHITEKQWTYYFYSFGSKQRHIFLYLKPYFTSQTSLAHGYLLTKEYIKQTVSQFNKNYIHQKRKRSVILLLSSVKYSTIFYSAYFTDSTTLYIQGN